MNSGAACPEVRVHADESAAALAAGVGADAFTRGADIYFAAGTYQPYSQAGRELLRHELAHVIQQASGDVSGFAGRVVPAAHPSEADARPRSALGRPARAAWTRQSNMQPQAIQRQLSAPGHAPAMAPPAGPVSKQGVKEVFDALVTLWGSLSVNRAQENEGDRMKGELAAFIQMMSERSDQDVEVAIRDRLGVPSNPARLHEFRDDYAVAIPRFATDIGRKVFSDLRALPRPDRLETWLWAKQKLAAYLQDGGRGSAFSDMVTNAIVGEVEKTTAEETRRKPAELREMDAVVVGRIGVFCTNFLAGVGQAGASFRLPMPVSGHFNKVAAGSAMTRFLHEIGHVFFKGHVAKLVLDAVPFATLALEIVSVLQEEQEQEERIRKEEERAALQQKAQRDFFKVWNYTVKAIEDREATLAALVVPEALKNHIDPKDPGTARLDSIIIRRLGFDPDVLDIGKN